MQCAESHASDGNRGLSGVIISIEAVPTTVFKSVVAWKWFRGSTFYSNLEGGIDIIDGGSLKSKPASSKRELTVS
jgi:hypothetical protein